MMINPASPAFTPAAKKDYTKEDMYNAVNALSGDPSLNRRVNMYDYINLYKQKNIDLEGWYLKQAVTHKRDAVKEGFLRNKQNSISSELAETLPLYANSQGRLGEHFDVVVTKTARPDDQGNSFVDFVLEVKNKWLQGDIPKKFADTQLKMTFLIDITVADASALHAKQHAFRREFLEKGKMANVKCYTNSLGEMGIDRPKIIIEKKGDYIEKVGGRLGKFILQHASDKFTIKAPEKFDEVYKEYFLDMMISIGENANANIVYIKNLPLTPAGQKLIKEYEKIVRFVEAYEEAYKKTS